MTTTIIIILIALLAGALTFGVQEYLKNDSLREAAVKDADRIEDLQRMLEDERDGAEEWEERAYEAESSLKDAEHRLAQVEQINGHNAFSLPTLGETDI